MSDIIIVRHVYEEKPISNVIELRKKERQSVRLLFDASIYAGPLEKIFDTKNPLGITNDTIFIPCPEDLKERGKTSVVNYIKTALAKGKGKSLSDLIKSVKAKKRS